MTVDPLECDHAALDHSQTLPLADAIAATYARPITARDGTRFRADEMSKIMVRLLRDGVFEAEGVCPTCHQPVFRSLEREGPDEHGES